MLITCKPNEIIEGQPQLWLGNLIITRYNTIFIMEAKCQNWNLMALESEWLFTMCKNRLSELLQKGRCRRNSW